MHVLFLHGFLLPVAAVFGIGYFKLKSGGKKSVPLKCLCSLLYLLTAAAALGSRGIFPPAHPVFWFLLCCVLADGLLELRFVPGMLLFGLGHCILILWMLSLSAPSWMSLVVWLMCLLAAWLLFRRHLLPMGKQAVPFVLYAGFLAAGAALGITLSFSLGRQFIPLSVGTAIFYVSDLLVAKAFFGKIQFWESILLMSLYWAALFLISMMTWLAQMG